MREFRNVAGKMIVVYDYDESVASRSATTLAQRGYDNVLMLSGGLRVAEMKFPSRDPVFSQVNLNSIENGIGREFIRVGP